METAQSRISDLSGNIREYIETRIDIVKLDAADAGASAASSLISWLSITIALVFTLLFLSLGGAIGIGYMINNYALGFIILAAVYIVVAIILYYNRENWIRKPVLNRLIKNIYENE